MNEEQRTVGKSKVWIVAAVSCSAAYVSHTRVQKRFIIQEVTADWHELMIPQRIMQPPVVRASEQLELGPSMQHADVSHTRP